MKNHPHEDTNKMIAGLLIGTIIGASTVCLLRTCTHRKPPALQRVGRTISDIGQMVSNCDLPKTASHWMSQAGQHLPQNKNVFSTVSDWIDNGLYLWNILKKG